MPPAVSRGARGRAGEADRRPRRPTLAAYYRSIAPELEPTRGKLAAGEEGEGRPRRRDARRRWSRRSGAPRTMRVLPRGNWLDESGEVVTPAVPAFLGPRGRGPPGDPARPGELAGRRRQPARRPASSSTGSGSCVRPGARRPRSKTSARKGPGPTHPELLDWLAVTFRESGWDVKRLLRLIVTRGPTGKSSHAAEPLRQADPYNQWLARQGRFRLDAEFVRDDMLVVSGLLRRQVGGPSVKPYQPAGYWAHLNFPKREYQNDHGDGLYRRGLYTYWCGRSSTRACSPSTPRAARNAPPSGRGRTRRSRRSSC